MIGHPRTAIEKIVARHCVGWTLDRPPRAGDFVTLRPRHVMTHDNTAAVIPKFRSIAGGDAPVADRSQPIFVMDHDIQNHSPENLAKYASIRSFAAAQGIRYEPPGRGIAHQVMIEEGFVRPWSLVVGSDSHSNMYGAMAALGTPVVRTDAAAIWATGETWWVVPQQVRVALTGRLSRGATGKDVILALCGRFTDGEVLNCAIEFAGEGVGTLTMDERMTIANMTTEWGALAGWFPFDDVLERYTRSQAFAGVFTSDEVERWRDNASRCVSDPGAGFVREIEVDLSTVSPHVTGPNSVSVSRPAASIAPERIRIDKAYLMSCVNARASDIEAAAEVFADGARVAPWVEFYIAPASSVVEREARASGAWQRLIDAGAIELPPGCGACIGLGRGTLRAGEVGISATNRNFEGRMGDRSASCYLASPAVVAASAISGYIDAPSSPAVEIASRCLVFDRGDAAPSQAQAIVEGFPSILRGRSLLLPRDSIDTDGMYDKAATYRDTITFEEQGTHAMRNYDPAFQQIARAGDILVAGERFGTGSSREQAATALASKGIALVIVASVSETFRRNAFNNGFMVIESPAAFRHLCGLCNRHVDAGERTIVGPEVIVDFERSAITVGGESFGFHPLSETAQRLIVAGGLERQIAQQLAIGGGVV